MAFDTFSNFVEIQKLKKELSAKSGNLVRYDVSLTAETDGQTEFPIELSTYDYLTDSIWVVSGRTILSSTLDYTKLEHSIVLNEGVPLGRTIDIYVYKNVENLDEEKTISGLQIAEGSIPLDRLAASVGGQMKLYTEMKVATEDGQTDFTIDLDTFVQTSDTVLVQAGTLMLFPDEDFTVSCKTITLVEGVHIGCTVGIYIFKQIEHTDVNYYINGVMIEPESIPLDRLAEEIPTPTAESIGAVKEENLATTVQSLLTGGEISMVKKVQRGTSSVKQNGTVEITLNEINPDKAVVHIHAWSAGQGDGTWDVNTHVLSLSSTKLTVKASTDGDINGSSHSMAFDWQVVEYY